jgi:Raf kinase inhibitor-like YbhB/YbcL family protein
MKLMSKDFKHNEMMDSKFTCDGKNISPHLKWDGAPTETKSFAISCNDPDAPAGDWIHWLVHGIQPNLTEIPQGGPISGTEVDNDFRRPKYGGPCPPSGTHRYFFRVYALKIAKLEGVSKKNFMDLVKKNTLESAEIIGLYKRKK